MAPTRTETLAGLKAAIDKLENELRQAQGAHEKVLRELAAAQELALRAQDARAEAHTHRRRALAEERMNPSVKAAKAARDAEAAYEAADREVSSQGEAVKGLQEVADGLSEELDRRRVAVREEATRRKAETAEALVLQLEAVWRKDVRPLLGQLASIHAVAVRSGACPPVVSVVDGASFTFENQLFRQSRFQGYDGAELKAERAANPEEARHHRRLMPRYLRETTGNSLGGVNAYLAPDLKCCPWPSCWAEPAGIGPYVALCSRHQLKRTAGGCAFGQCPRDALGEPLCAYHDKIARGLIDPMGHDPMRQRVLAVLPRRSGVRGRMSGADLLQRKRELGLPVRRSWIEAAEGDVRVTSA